MRLLSSAHPTVLGFVPYPSLRAERRCAQRTRAAPAAIDAAADQVHDARNAANTAGGFDSPEYRRTAATIAVFSVHHHGNPSWARLVGQLRLRRFLYPVCQPARLRPPV